MAGRLGFSRRATGNFCLCLAAAGWLLAASVAQVVADCPTGGGESGRVVEVLDGDTLVLASGLTVRLAGIEAPKRRPGEEPKRASRSAETARQALETLVKGFEVTLLGSGARDRYGRAVALVRRADGRFLQEMLIERGLARVHGWESGDCLAAPLEREAAARQAGLGLWRDPQYAVRDADDPSLPTQKGLYELVEGRVASVGRGRRVVFLNFGQDWQRDFTVTIATGLAARLAGGGDPVDAFAGKLVRVRGVIEERGGPLIRVADQSSIEILGDDGSSAAD
jgi:micrococcal nuclease